MNNMTHLLRLTAINFLICSFVVGAAQAAQLNTVSTLVDETDSSPASPVLDSNSQQFAKVIDDLPLMPGLSLDQDDDVLFVAPSAGRIAETEAAGTVDVDDVYRFYRKTLPQMGWKIADARSFRREGEILYIDAKADGKDTRVYFTVKPTDK